MKNPIREYLRLVRAVERAKSEGRTGEWLQALRANAEIQKTMMRPRQYAAINGTGEIGWGAALLFMSLSSYSAVMLPASPWRGGFGLTLLLCGAIVMPLCLWAGRKFVNEPRVGYLALLPEKSRWIGMAVGMVFAIGISLALVFLLQRPA